MTTTETTPTPATPAAAARDAILEALQTALNELDGLPEAEFSLNLDGDGYDEATIKIDHNGREIDSAVLETRLALNRALEVAKQALDNLPTPEPVPEERLQAAFNAGWNRACRAMDYARLCIQHYHDGPGQGQGRLPCRDEERKEAGY